MNKKFIFLLAVIPLFTSCSCSQTGKNRHREDSEDPKQEEIEFDKKILKMEKEKKFWTDKKPKWTKFKYILKTKRNKVFFFTFK